MQLDWVAFLPNKSINSKMIFNQKLLAKLQLCAASAFSLHLQSKQECYCRDGNEDYGSNI